MSRTAAIVASSSGDVVGRLGRALGAWDGTAHGIEHQNPAQGHLCHARPDRRQGPELLDGGQAHFVRHPGKGLAHVECLPRTVKTAMVVGFEHRVRPHLADEQAACVLGA
jgi:hypothetical protein